ncbi:hypothetical protein FSOLCH5_005896 [Fusarium solani]
MDPGRLAQHPPVAQCTTGMLVCLLPCLLGTELLLSPPRRCFCSASASKHPQYGLASCITSSSLQQDRAQSSLNQQGIAERMVARLETWKPSHMSHSTKI